MRYIAGLDIGSAISKAVIMEDDKLLSFSTATTEGNFSSAADSVLEDALAKAKLSLADIHTIGALGLGATFITHPFEKVSDISCQSRGTHYFFPSVRTLIEVGNQASKIIKVTPKGKVADCLVSDRCAAGSSRILQIIAKVLKVNLEDMGQLSLDSTAPVKFTTGCAVFLETEAVSRVAEGSSKENIIAGLHNALASRISAMAQRLRLEADFAITGGGAKDSGLVKIMEDRLGHSLLVPENPLITGVIGAALIAAEKTS
ncbi:acyl-CoA dehydratase activase [Thermodesulfobacteriota bacterium]